MRGFVKRSLTSVANRHSNDGEPDVFLFATPRGGSTWLMELIWSQPGFKTCNEPLDLRKPLVRRHLKLDDWDDLYGRDATAYLERYFRGLSSGRWHFLDPNPLRGKHYRFSTNRIVFKVLHGGEDRIAWFRDAFGARIVLLLRHPIAVSLSREVYPRLQTFVRSDYRRHFTNLQLDEAQRIIDRGSKLERGVLDWCFQNSVPLKDATPDWAVVTYEQLVLQPEKAIAHLACKLSLPQPTAMAAGIGRASLVRSKSDPETQGLLGRQDRERLVYKWKDKVSPDEERSCEEILRLFGIDAYGVDPLPAKRLLV